MTRSNMLCCAVEVFHSPKQCYRHSATNQHDVVELKKKTNYYNTTGGMYKKLEKWNEKFLYIIEGLLTDFYWTMVMVLVVG